MKKQTSSLDKSDRNILRFVTAGIALIAAIVGIWSLSFFTEVTIALGAAVVISIALLAVVSDRTILAFRYRAMSFDLLQQKMGDLSALPIDTSEQREIAVARIHAFFRELTEFGATLRQGRKLFSPVHANEPFFLALMRMTHYRSNSPLYYSMSSEPWFADLIWFVMRDPASGKDLEQLMVEFRAETPKHEPVTKEYNIIGL